MGGAPKNKKTWNGVDSEGQYERCKLRVMGPWCIRGIRGIRDIRSIRGIRGMYY